MTNRRRNERGQAVVEVAVAVVVLLLPVMMAILYFGQVMATQQQLNAAVRYAARQMAIESTRGDPNRLYGSYVRNAANDTGKVREMVAKAMNVDPARITVSKLDKGVEDLLAASSGNAKLHFLGDYVVLLLAQGRYEGPIKPAGGSVEPMQFGAGVLFYGCKVSYRLSGLDWVARILGLQGGITLQASSLMPAELPLHGQIAGITYGLADLNRWVAELARADVDARYADKQLFDPSQFYR